MIQPHAPRDPRRAPRPAPARPATTRALRPAAPDEPAAALPEPTPAERIRLRRLVRGVLIGVVVVQSIALTLVLVPSANAQFAVIDAAVVQGVARLDLNIGRLFATANSRLQTANTRLQQILRLQQDNDRVLSGGGQAQVASSDVGDVTETPLRLSHMTSQNGSETGISFADANPDAALARVIPGAVRWTNYTQQRRASTDMVLLSLRGGMRSLHDFNRTIQDDTRLMAISRASQRNSLSDHALQQLQIESSLEVARQLQALRAQQALQTSLYAVTESHKVGLEGRQFAQDTGTDCEVIAGILGGVLGGLCDGPGISVLTP